MADMAERAAQYTVKYTRQQVAEKNKSWDAAIIIDNVVYDVTEFLQDHPGGPHVLLDNAGTDCSQCFADVGHSDVAMDWRKQFVAGEVVEQERWEEVKRPVPPEPEEEPLTLGSLLSVWGPPLVLAGLAALIYSFLFA